MMIIRKKLRNSRITIMFFVIVAIILIGYFVDKAIRCNKNGYSKDDAIKIAWAKIAVDFDNSRFVLKNEQFSSYDKSWLFTYHKGGCVVDVIVDNCGVSDIGGLTEECTSLIKP